MRPPTFSIGTDGHLDVTASAKTIALGSFSLALPAFTVHVGANGTGAQLQLGSSSLTAPGIGTFTIPAVNVGVSGLFSVTLASGSFSMGSLTIDGRLVFERAVPSGGGSPVFRLSVLNATNGTKPKLVIPGLANVNLNEFFIASDTTFSVAATTTRIGPNELSIRNASITVRKTGAALSTFGVDIDGGQLFIPDGTPLDLPDLTISSSASFSRTFSIPGIDLGPAFQSSAATVRLGLSGGVLALTLPSPVNLSVLAGSVGVRLNSFDVESDGTFTGSVTGQLKLAGFLASSATFGVSLHNGVARLSSGSPFNVNLGFLTTRFSGFVDSTGAYGFDGTSSLGFGVLGFSVSGTGTFHLRDTGFAGSLSGSACAPVVGCVGASGSISSTGLISGTIATSPVALGFTYQL